MTMSNQHQSNQLESQQLGSAPSRRHFIKLSVLSSSVLLASGLIASAAPSPDTSTTDFYSLATFLVAKPQLSAPYAAAVFSALKKNIPDFAPQLQAVLDTVKRIQAPDVTRLFAGFTEADQAVRKTCLLIIETFYTGNVGRGATAKAVAYEMALMFDTTKDVTVIPTYIRGRPEYWTATPLLTGV
ncbi:sugar dehydrogenase complex small subunit [Aquirhabdus sp.]|uniref:sugar dehydrogenase complex small subunit n=1 Tax=Aquirhabdus sp. TaxID=2824160 RepID=UPI00396C3C64